MSYFIEYNDALHGGWFTYEGATLDNMVEVAEVVAEELDQFGRVGDWRKDGPDQLRVTRIEDGIARDVTEDIALLALSLRPHLSDLDALAAYADEECEAA